MHIFYVPFKNYKDYLFISMVDIIVHKSKKVSGGYNSTQKQKD